jgi:plasmid stability protein
MVTLTLDLDQRTVDKLRERAAQEGKSTDAWVAELLREQVAHDALPTATENEARRAKAAEYGLDVDDPLLDIIGLMGDVEGNAEDIVQETLSSFYGSHLDSPR